MHVRFPDVDENFIKGKVNGGFYTSENEAVRDAVRRMRQEEERIQRFQAAVALGDADLAAGRMEPLTPELMKSIRQRAIDKARTGTASYHPDVTP